jgi:hypothetical protein
MIEQIQEMNPKKNAGRNKNGSDPRTITNKEDSASNAKRPVKIPAIDPNTAHDSCDGRFAWC